MREVVPIASYSSTWRIVSTVLVCLLSLPGLSSAAGAGSLVWTDPLFARTWELTPIPYEFLLHFESGVGQRPDLRKGPSNSTLTSLIAEIDVTALEAYRPASRTLRVRAQAQSVDVLRQRIAAQSVSVQVSPVVRDREGFTKFFRPDEFMVQFDRALSPQEGVRRIESSGLVIRRDYWTPGLFRLALPGSAELSATIQAWANREDVRFSEPAYLCFDDLLASSSAPTGIPEPPDDPLFANQWGLRNPGIGSWKATADVQADAAWWIETGDPNVIIAYIDTGADFNHEDLLANLAPRNGDDWNFEDSQSSEPFDILSHGTAVTGIGSAVQGNGLGITGLAPGCRFMPLRVSLDAGDYAERVDAINYAASRLPEFSAMILNCSWGNSSGDFTAQRLAIEDAHAAGCVLVCASGNTDDAVIYPARYPETIAVGATSPCDERTQSTSCDGESFWGSCFGPELDVVAPGVRIQTTDRTGTFGYTSTNYHATFNGTSASAPLVSATIALLYSANPDLDNEEVRDLLRAGADDEVGQVEEDTPGFDVYHGFGRVNAYRSLVLATHPEGVSDDLETGAPGWKHGPMETAIDSWNLSSNDNHSAGGTTSWSSAEMSTGSYPAGSHAALYVPDFWVPADGWLRFWHRMQATEFGPGVGADGGRLEISSDGGETWNHLVSAAGYTHVTGIISDPFPPSTPIYSGEFAWAEVEVDLSSFVNGPARIRFIFGSRSDLGAETVGSGWWIDDLRIESTPSTAPPVLDVDSRGFWMSLPPVVVGASEVRFGWDSSEKAARPSTVHWILYSAAGRTLAGAEIALRGSGPEAFTFDPRRVAETPLSSGVYFLRLRSDSQWVQQKLTVLR